jgi:hypothetical protein
MIKLEFSAEEKGLEVVNFVLAQFKREFTNEEGNIDIEKAREWGLSAKDVERVEVFRNKLLQAGFYKINSPKNVGGNS